MVQQKESTSLRSKRVGESKVVSVGIWREWGFDDGRHNPPSPLVSYCQAETGAAAISAPTLVVGADSIRTLPITLTLA